MNDRKIVEINGVGMNYHTLDGETVALKEINLDIFHGEIVVLVGPSGCGKSTLLSIIAGLIKPTKGNVCISGKEVKEPSKDIGYMFQRDHLFEWRNILDNVLIGLEIQNKINDESRAFAEKLLDVYGLSEFKNHYPRQLSGGMRQRVALIRTLAVQPELLLLDEPFSALDYQTRLAIADEIGIILKQEKRTALMVTHDIADAISPKRQNVLGMGMYCGRFICTQLIGAKRTVHSASYSILFVNITSSKASLNLIFCI